MAAQRARERAPRKPARERACARGRGESSGGGMKLSSETIWRLRHAEGYLALGLECDALEVFMAWCMACE